MYAYMYTFLEMFVFFCLLLAMVDLYKNVHGNVQNTKKPVFWHKESPIFIV
jgi:hypothetical protein